MNYYLKCFLNRDYSTYNLQTNFLEKFGYHKITQGKDPRKDLELEQLGYFRIPYTINDLNIKNKFEIERHSEARRKVKIIVVDDQEFMPLVSLRDSYHYDIKQNGTIDDPYMVAEYDIILCDNQGVAVKLSPKNGGATLIKEIKKNYPNKSVIAYTASSFNPKVSDDWVSILDDFIEKRFDLKYQWRLTRTALLEKGLSIVEVAKLEAEYVNAVNNKSLPSLKDSYSNSEFPGSEIIVNLLNITSSAITFLQSIGVV